MTSPANDYWSELCRNNPGLTTSSHLRLTVDSLRRVVEQAYSRGQLDAKSPVADMSSFEALFGSFATRKNHP